MSRSNTLSHPEKKTLSKVEQWEKDVGKSLREEIPTSGSAFMLSHLINGFISIDTEHKLFTEDQREYMIGSFQLCKSMSDEERTGFFKQLREGKYYSVVSHFLPKQEEAPKEFEDKFLASLYASYWINKFKGSSLKSLRAYVLKQEELWSSGRYYAKIIPVIQSSGMGKSRLLSEFSKTTPSVYYTLREDDDTTGYPPGDTLIRNYFREMPAGHEDLFATCFLAATFKRCEWRILVEQILG